MKKPFVIREEDITAYQPANHTGTFNRRLISPETVGSKSVEVLLGTIEPGQGAQRHAHPGIEQVCYLLEGEAIAELDGVEQHMKPGDCCFFPADVPHTFTVVGDTPARLLVVYTPPYEESADRVIRYAEPAE